METPIYPFTKQALLAIFKRNTPLFSYETKLKSNIHYNSIDDRITFQDHKLSFKEYIEQQFFTLFNNHYDQYENMRTNNHLSQDNQYVWAQKQHVLIVDIIMETNNIEFVKCISSIENNQFEFLTITYDSLMYDDVIEKISISFRPNHYYENEIQPSHDNPISNTNDVPLGIFRSSCRHLVKSNIINNIVLDNGDTQQHDIYHNDTKIGNYRCSISKQNELWYVYCDSVYVNNNKVMEINIKRWNTSDYNFILHTIQYCHESTTAPIHSPNIRTIRSYTCLNQYGIFNMIIKANLNSKTIDNNLYIYPIPDYFNSGFEFKKVVMKGIKLNIYNSVLTDFVVIENNDTMTFHILSFHYEDNKLSIMFHLMKNIKYNNQYQASITDNIVICKDKSYEQFDFQNCRFDALYISNHQIVFWVTEGNGDVKSAIFIIDTVKIEWYLFCDLRKAQIEGVIHVQKVYAERCPNKGHIKFGIICLLQLNNSSRVVTLIGMIYQHHHKDTLFFNKYIEANSKEYSPLFSIIQCNQILSTLEMYCEPI